MSQLEEGKSLSKRLEEMDEKLTGRLREMGFTVTEKEHDQNDKKLIATFVPKKKGK